jgi:hypothetical protein
VSVWLVVLPKGVNPWIVVVMFLFLVLVAGLAKAIQRPRHAEDELRQQAATVTPRPLDSASLRACLLSAQAQRRTGTLQVTAGGRTCSLYFLFGHLFHVASDTLTGEPALQECLTWQDIHYTFDPKATLPTEETIERPIDQILAA